MKKQHIACFDIGGTNMRAATITSDTTDYTIVDRESHKTSSFKTDHNIQAIKHLENVEHFLSEYVRSSQLKFGTSKVSVAFPGPVRDESTVLALPTIWGPDGATLCPINLKSRLKKQLPDMSIRIMNDVSAAGYRFINNSDDFALFTLGSGVGMKVFINGKPYVGPNGFGGELTHMMFDHSADAPLCDCGGRGIWAH